MSSDAHVSEYPDAMVVPLEWIRGRDFKAPGGEGNVRKMIAGIELDGRGLRERRIAAGLHESPQVSRRLKACRGLHLSLDRHQRQEPVLEALHA